MALLVLLLALIAATAETDAQVGGIAPEGTAGRPPNIVIMFTDDLGYGDIAPYGHPTIRTPNLDRMAAEGMKLTQFYVGSAVCTPSRAALLTGRYPVRTGLVRGRLMPARVLFPGSEQGLPPEEVTIAEVLRGAGYRTAAIGKWHVGDHAPYLPNQQGFDLFFGLPHSNDMERIDPPDGAPGYWDLPLLRNRDVVERPADQTTLTRRYTEESLRFIRENRDAPFFLYLAHSMPHIPLFRSPAFAGVSSRGVYGDVIEEIDWSVGQVLDALRREGLAGNTLVIFTSDNGPWLVMEQEGGTAGLLRDGKTSSWEGGFRVPMIAWWPGTVPAGRTSQAIASTMDFLPTAAGLAGAPLPDRTLDGTDLMPVLRGDAEHHHDFIAYCRGTRLYAARLGPWKAHFWTQAVHPTGPLVRHDPPLLYQLEHDPGERFDLAAERPDVIAAIRARADEHMASIEPPPSPEVEAEDLISSARVTAGAVTVQDMSAYRDRPRGGLEHEDAGGTGWSGDAQLRWVLARPGDRLTLPIGAVEAGTYQLTGWFGRNRDHAIVRLYVGGREIRPLVDGYAPQPEPTRGLVFDPLELPAGETELSLEIVGKDARSAGYADGYVVGLDGFTLRRVDP